MTQMIKLSISSKIVTFSLDGTVYEYILIITEFNTIEKLRASGVTILENGHGSKKAKDVMQSFKNSELYENNRRRVEKTT